MKATKNLLSSLRRNVQTAGTVCLLLLPFTVVPVSADETCMSPYMAKIVGQEDYVYIWTLGVEGVGALLAVRSGDCA